MQGGQVNGELERMWKEAVVAYFFYFLFLFPANVPGQK
jgi:hypothetical protein